MKQNILLVLLLGATLATHAQPGPGYALRFPDTGSYVAVPQAVGLNSFPFTVMAWVQTSATSGQQGLVNKYVAGSQNGWNLFLLNGRVRAWYFASNSRFVWDGSDGLDGGSIADGAWHHVAFAVDGSGGRLYVDGVLRASRAWTGTSGPPSTAQEMRFANYPGGILSFFGTISLDEITVWNAALSQSQVAANLFTPLAGNEPNLVALYRCNEGGGISVADSAPLGGSNHGSWVGTPLFVPTVVAPQAASEGGASRGNCSGTPGITELKLDWRGQNVAGCKVDLDWSRSRIRRVAADCTTIYYADLPSEAPRQWTILSQPIGADIDVEVTPVSARLPLPVAGDYTVQLTVCPGDCVVPGPNGTGNFPMVPTTATITIRAEAELPLRAQERPVLPPSAMVPTPRLALSEAQRNCLTLGGGGVTHPQWVSIHPWNGPNDYKLVEGAVVSAWPSTRASLLNHDLAFNGGDWYVINDVVMTVSPDPCYFNLLSMKPESEPNPHLLPCEVQYNTVPDRFCPVEGDRISLWGFWVLDAGRAPADTAMHPAVGWAVHRNQPVRIPDGATFTFDLHSNTVVSTAGNNLYVPGIVSDVWFNADTGGAIRGDPSSLAQAFACTCHAAIVTSPIQREYDFNIYLPKNPSQVFAEVGITSPRAPLHVSISNPHGSPGPDPTYTRMTETVNGVTYEYLRVHLDLGGHSHSNYSRRIEAAWVYPRADNWGLEQWRVTLDRLDVYDDLDSKLRFPGSDGDWVLWMMLPGAEQSWTRVRDGINSTHGTVPFSPAWQTGAADPVLQRAPLSLDTQRRLGPDVLTFNRSVKFWLGGFEADEADGDPDEGGEGSGDRSDPGRVSGLVFNSGHSNVVHSHNDVFSATVTGTRVAIHSNGVLTAAATQLGRHYLLYCTNRINDRRPIQDSINPFGTPGLLLEGISGEPPWSPVDPQQIYGGGAALLGDVNGDGFPDVALGTHSNAQAHLFLGGRNGFAPAPFAIASVPFSHSNLLSQGRVGAFVGAGDLNDDGIPDLLIGAPTFNVHSNFLNIHSNAGAVFAFSGAQLRAGGSFAHSNALWAVGGSHSNAQFGFAVAAGDINRDGISDVVIGAPFHSNVVTAGRPLGRVFVYFGSPLIHSNTTPGQVVPPPLLDTISDHWFGYSVSMAGDVNRDGYTDVVIGAPRFTRIFQNQGACYLYYGSPTGLVLHTSLRLEGFDFNAQFGFSVAGAGDVDGDTFPDVLVGAPFSSGSELTLQNGYAALYRGSAGGLIPTAAWLKYGETGGIHTGADVGPVGDLNGDGRADIAVGTPDDTSPDGLRGRVTYFLGNSNPASLTETWPVRGVNRVASLMINSPCCVPFISPCCNTGSTNKVDFNFDGFADALTYSSLTHSTRVDRVRLVLGRGQRAVLPTTEPFFRAGATAPFAFQSVFHSNFVANLTASGQTDATLHSNLLGRVQDILFTVQQAGGDAGSLLPLLQRLQVTHSNLVNLGFIHSNLFNQFFASVDLDAGTAFYIDCGATNEYTDVLGRRWLPDAPFLATSSSGAQLTVFTGIGPITNTLTGDAHLPDAMLNSERWFNGHIRYQVAVPNGWYTVLLYFSENYPPAVSSALGGTGGATFARLFDLEVEGQRVSAYNQADAALPPAGDGFGRLYTATQVPFTVHVADGLLDIAVLDRGPANPPENAAIKGIAILGRPDPATKFATRPRVARTTRDGGAFGVSVDPQASLARYWAGEIGLRLQSSSNLTQWVTLPNLPGVGANGAAFSLPAPTNRSTFLRAVIPAP